MYACIVSNKIQVLKFGVEEKRNFKKKMVFCYHNCSSDREKLLKFETEGREFSKFFRSQEEFIQTVKGQNNFW